jgi:hypothetical protein
MQRQVMREGPSAHGASQANSDTIYGAKAPGNRVIHRFGETHRFCARLALISLTISSAQLIGVFDVVSTVMSY